MIHEDFILNTKTPLPRQLMFKESGSVQNQSDNPEKYSNLVRILNSYCRKCTLTC